MTRVNEGRAGIGRLATMISMKWLLIVIAVPLALLAVAAVAGSWKWASATDQLESELATARRTTAMTRFDPRELEGLPAPVQRYFRAALSAHQAIVTAATLEHSGSFNMSEDAENWKSFTSRQHIVASRPGFVWNARIAIAPGLAVHVHDAYVAGAGRLHAAIAGLVTVADLKESPELAEGELMRFLAEAAWVPTSLLPSQGVRWEPVDEHSARATLSDGPVTVTLTFGFAANGPIQTVRAEARGRTVAGQVVPTPWEGRWSDVREQGGMRIPMSGEVAWITPEGRKPYWRGTITSVRYQFAP